ncbi:tumor necrosis factor receptor superfamily member 5-like isoform X2 [Argopecten irradians]|uniref:tumor necrosis factor receptor superfamily member 5-like isoform X2 n=1 Tax=Argopecten irradians TaxID=31199 RepID=UPI003716884C
MTIRTINQRSMSSDLLQITILLLSCVRLCSKSTQPDITYYTNNGRRCVKCSPGTYLVADCEEENESAKCQLCPDGFYISQYNIARNCIKCKSSCENDQLVQITNCSRIQNMECACPNGMFNSNPDLEPWDAKCVVYGSCGPGHGMRYTATPVKNTTCERCVPGTTFSSTTSSSDRCQPCTPCGQFKVKRECNTTHNRVCDTNGISSSEYQDGIKDNKRLEAAIVVVAPIAGILLLAVPVYILYKKHVCCKRHDENIREKATGSSTDNANTSFPGSVNSGVLAYSLPKNRPSPTSANQPTSLSIPEDDIDSTNLKQLNPENLQQLPHSPNRFNGTDIDWRYNIFKINSYLSTELINQQWKHVIRHLYEGCGQSSDADREITEQEKNCVGNIKEQIYQCILSWSRNPGASARILGTALATEWPHLLQGLRDKFPRIFNESQV